MRRAAKRDTVEPAIIEALTKAGWQVAQISAKDAPDLVICKHGRIVFAEVKTGNAPLRPGQRAWLERWEGEVVILRTVEDALAL